MESDKINLFSLINALFNALILGRPLIWEVTEKWLAVNNFFKVDFTYKGALNRAFTAL